MFRRAGEKGWKGLIPIYSDYIYYKISWSGSIYIKLLLLQVGAIIISAVCGMIHPTFGTVIGVILNTISMSAFAIAGLILKFKMAHAFGRNDYFVVGLYFFESIFTAILAFGSDVTYQGPQTGAIGAASPKEEVEQPAAAPVVETPVHQEPRPQQAMQRPQQPQQPAYDAQRPFQRPPMQQPNYQNQPMQRPQPYGGYPTQSVAQPQRPTRRTRMTPDAYPQETYDQNQ